MSGRSGTGREERSAVSGGRDGSGWRGGSDCLAGLLALPQSLFADPVVLGLEDSAQPTRPSRQV